MRASTCFQMFMFCALTAACSGHHSAPHGLDAGEPDSGSTTFEDDAAPPVSNSDAGAGNAWADAAPLPTPDAGVCGAASASCACPLAGFPQRRLDVPVTAESVAVADLNGDGKLDIVSTRDDINSDDDDGVQVLLQNGAGSFVASGSYKADAGGVPAIGDLNGDKKPDIAVLSFDVARLSVFLNKGGGKFADAVQYFTSLTQKPHDGDKPTLGLADMNGDKHVDIVTPHSILPGNGDGTFAMPVVFGQGRQVLVADFNADGKPDAAVLDLDLEIFLNQGDLKLVGYRYPTSPSFAYPADIALGDFNGDQFPDIVGSFYAPGEDTIGGVEVLINQGDGSFAAPAPYHLRNWSQNITVADMTGDGFADIVVGVTPDQGLVDILPGKGDGTFADDGTVAGDGGKFGATTTYYVPANNFVAADMDSNGTLDLVSDVTVTYNLGNGVLRTLGKLNGVVRAYGVASADLNADGKVDLLAANVDGQNLSVYLGKGDGTFGAHTDFGTGKSPWSMAVSDLNGDHKLDVAVANGGDASASVLLGKGDGTFGAARSYAVDQSPDMIALGDLNGDGHDDMAVANYDGKNVSVLLNAKNGTFGKAQNIALGDSPVALASADLDGNGKVELIVASYKGQVTVFQHSGATFVKQYEYTLADGAVALIATDLDGDHKADLAVANHKYEAASITVLLNQGHGTFGPRTVYPCNLQDVVSLVAGDLNGDGLTDLAALATFESRVSVFSNTGRGVFGKATQYFVPVYYHSDWVLAPSALAAADLDGDHRLDLVASSLNDEGVSLLLNAPSCAP